MTSDPALTDGNLAKNPQHALHQPGADLKKSKRSNHSILSNPIEKIDALMVGIVPPPYHGQSMVTKALFDADLTPLTTKCIELSYNSELAAIGKFRLRKIFQLLIAIGSTIHIQYSTKTKLLYYTPGSANLVPFLKDLIFLSIVRPFFPKTVLHYHSAGLPEFLAKNCILSILGRLAYGRGAYSLALSQFVPVPSKSFGVKDTLVIPNGALAPHNLTHRPPAGIFTLGFLGNLYEEKGIFEAFESALKIASERPDTEFRLQIAGPAPCAAVEEKLKTLLTRIPSNLTVNLLGRVQAQKKWNFLQDCNILLFPSYYKSENFPITVLEAMAAGLPVIATDWAALPSIVTDAETGFIVEPKNADQLRNAIARILDNPELEVAMSKKAQETFLAHFTWNAFLKRFRMELTGILNNNSA